MEIVLLLFLIGLILFNILKKDILNLASPLFLISIMFTFLYVVQIIFFDDIYASNKWVDLVGPNKQLFLLLIFFSLLAFTGGYGLKRKTTSRRTQKIISFKKLEKYSIFIGFFGLVIYLYFITRSGFSSYYSGHHGDADFSVGALIYYMQYFIFTALAVLFNIHLYVRLSWSGKMAFWLFLLFLILDGTLRQQRGSWIRLIVIFFISYIIFLYQSGNLSKSNLLTNFKRYSKIISFGIVGSGITVSMVALRRAGGDIPKLIDILISDPMLLFAGSGVNIGNEYVTAYNAFIAYLQHPAPDFGLKWTVPILNFIPSNIWPEKPRWNETSTSVFDYMDSYSYVIHALGSAETGLIDAFYRFSFLTPVFFFFLGMYSKSLYSKAIHGDIKNIIFYICYYIGLIYFLTQNMFPFITFTIFMYIPVGVYFFVKRVRIR